jgi:hypothetical protein
VCVRDFEETNQPKKLNWKLDGWICMYLSAYVHTNGAPPNPSSSLPFHSVPFRCGLARRLPADGHGKRSTKVVLSTGSSETKDTTQGELVHEPSSGSTPNEICIRTYVRHFFRPSLRKSVPRCSSSRTPNSDQIVRQNRTKLMRKRPKAPTYAVFWYPVLYRRLHTSSIEDSLSRPPRRGGPAA